MKIPLLLKKKTKKFVENLFDIKIRRTHAYHGYEDWVDIKRSGCPIHTIFDVGANVGQSALKFQKAFPEAMIYCFEPMSSAFNILKTNVTKRDNINCYPLALGSRQETTTIYLTKDFSMSSLIKPLDVRGSESVTMQTIDNFTLQHSIERIDLLKIDTEGFDLEVLKGASNLLSARRIPFILTEVGFHPGDKRHVLFDDVRAFLMTKGFAVFGIYDQRLERSGEQRLRFVNVCFCNEEAFARQNGAVNRVA